jgi:hypothetical protein
VNPALVIAAALDRNLSAPTEIVVFGTAAVLLDARFASLLPGKMTNDIDLIVPASRELAIDADLAFWAAIEATNRQLSPEGLYLTHIFPEREVILSTDWHEHLQTIETPWAKLRIQRPRLLDLVLSKMGRGDAQDCDDVRTLLGLEHTVTGKTPTAAQIEAAAQSARVPEVYREIFPSARRAILAAVAHANSAIGLR